MPSPSPLAVAAGADDAPPLTVAFSVHASAEPGVMPRIIELFAKRGLVPQHWSSTVAGSRLTIDLRTNDLDRDLAAYIARSMRQIVGVESVMTSG
jgi:hypothetical protein